MASFTDNEDARRKSSINTHEYFVPVAEGLNTKEGISFDPSWLSPRFWSPEEAKKAHLPANLPAPDFVQVFQLDQQASSTKEATLQQVGKSAYDIANACLSTSATSAVLFRGLSAKILNAKDFTDFWKACLAEPSSKNRKKWNPVSYVPFGVQRNTLEGIDLVTNFPPENALACHNEMVYNPQPAGRIAFYCLEAAPDGGETILARNVDHSRHVSQELQGMVRKHGGIQYTRRYYDKRNPNEDSSNRFHVSWQEKTGTQDPNEAIHFFEFVGFSVPEQVHFETYDDGFQKLIVKNVESGFNAQGNWFNILNMGMFPLADGTVVPKAMIQQLVLDEWRSVHALKLVPGDWIVLNNQTLQHGRLPYRNSGEQKRTILTVYTD